MYPALNFRCIHPLPLFHSCYPRILVSFIVFLKKCTSESICHFFAISFTFYSYICMHLRVNLMLYTYLHLFEKKFHVTHSWERQFFTTYSYFEKQFHAICSHFEKHFRAIFSIYAYWQSTWLSTQYM